MRPSDSGRCGRRDRPAAVVASPREAAVSTSGISILRIPFALSLSDSVAVECLVTTPLATAMDSPARQTFQFTAIPVTRVITALVTRSVPAFVSPLITALVTALVTRHARRHDTRHSHFDALDRIGTFSDSQAR